MATRFKLDVVSPDEERPCELYVMIKPPACEAGRMRALDLCSCATDRLHMTIVPLGSARHWPGCEMEALKAGLGRIHHPRFPLSFDRLRANGRHAELVGSTPMREARAFARRVFEVLAPLAASAPAGRGGEPLRERTLRPHVTLNYRTNLRCDERIAPIAWMADAFLLVESIHGIGHTEHGRWPLAPTLL